MPPACPSARNAWGLPGGKGSPMCALPHGAAETMVMARNYDSLFGLSGTRASGYQPDWCRWPGRDGQALLALSQGGQGSTRGSGWEGAILLPTPLCPFCCFRRISHLLTWCLRLLPTPQDHLEKHLSVPCSKMLGKKCLLTWLGKGSGIGPLGNYCRGRSADRVH